MRILVLLALLVVAACGDNTVVMRKPGGTKDAAWKRDSYDCLKDAYALGDATANPYGARREPNMEIYQMCMEARGYVRQN